MDPGWREDPKIKVGSYAVYDVQVDSMDRVHVLRENRFSEKTPVEVGEAMRRRHNAPWIWKAIISDPADPAAPRDFCKGFGTNFRIINFDKGDVQSGIRDVHGILRLRPDGTTGLLIDPSCKDAIWEMNAYRYRDIQEGRAPSEEPLDTDDHFPDCLRYLRKAYARTRPHNAYRGEIRDFEKTMSGYND
jgi:hypothetical protein